VKGKLRMLKLLLLRRTELGKLIKKWLEIHLNHQESVIMPNDLLMAINFRKGQKRYPNLLSLKLRMREKQAI